MEIRKAVRRKQAVKIALSGPSGSGKTMSALRIGSALAAKIGGRVVLIDSESGSGELYQGERVGGVELDYDVLRLTEFTVSAYLDAMRICAESAEHSVVVVDSTTHLWATLLDEVDKATNSRGQSDKFSSGWRAATPKYNQFLAAVVAYPKHAIFTVRSKQEYQVDAATKRINKLGLAPVMRDGFEYEVTLALAVDERHVAEVTKTRIAALDEKRFEKPGAEIADALLAWLDGGAPEAPRAASPIPAAPGAAVPGVADKLSAALAGLTPPTTIADVDAWRESRGEPPALSLTTEGIRALVAGLRNGLGDEFRAWLAARPAEGGGQ